LETNDPNDAQDLVIAAIRRGIIPVSQEPDEPQFSDMGIGYGEWKGLSEASQEWISVHDESEHLFHKMYVISTYLEEDQEDDIPEEVKQQIDLASDEGYGFIVY